MFKHHAVYRYPAAVKKVFGRCNTIDQLISHIEIVSRSLPITDRYIFKGGMFEVFVEELLNSEVGYSSFGVSHYRPVNSDIDVGVDGVGEDDTGSPITVQSKYKSNVGFLSIDDDMLERFLLASTFEFGVPIDASKEHRIIITTCKGLASHDHSRLYDKCKCVTGEQISQLVDYCNPFWERLSIQIEGSIANQAAICKLLNVNTPNT